MTPPIRIAVLLTCHNRREATLRCLASVAAQATDADLAPFVVDASSPDGTADAVREAHPDATVAVVGDDVFWNRGMHHAWELARATSPDAYLWLNDDTTLDDDAVARLVATWRSRPAGELAVVVGSTRDPETGVLTYGGVVRPSMKRPLAYELVPPGDAPVPATTMNGNCVLVPADVVDRIGVLDPSYTHGMGDYDYGHRLQQAGGTVWVAPGTVGTCSRNPEPPADRSARDEWQRLRRPTGLPPADFARYARKWAGPLWPLYWASPYVRRILRQLRAGGGRSRA